MKGIGRLVAAVLAGGILGLSVLPFVVVAVLAGQRQASAQVAASWDIPPELVPLLSDAGQQAGIPWFILAAVASVATDFARHAPDGLARGQNPDTAIFPVVTPAIRTAEGAAGMFLVDVRQVSTALPDPQNVRAELQWLAGRVAALAGSGGSAGSAGNAGSAGGGLSTGGDLADPATSRIWRTIMARSPLLIAAVVSGGGADLTPVDPGTNPIRQFGGAVLARIGAPVSGANLDAFAAWASGEGSCARFNPLATTQPEPGATPFNTLTGGGHVWNYPSFAVGVQATTTALTNGRYQPVIDALRASAGVAAVAAAVVRSPWGTQQFGSPSYAGAKCSATMSPPLASPPLPTLSGPDAIAATIVARAARYQVLWFQMAALAPASGG